MAIRSGNKLLSVAEERLRRLDLRIAKERDDFPSQKSRAVRMSSRIGPRIGFFLDLRVELFNTIQFLRGERSEEDYITCQNGDNADEVGLLVSTLGS